MLIRKLVGEKCYLTPMRIEDAEKYATWLNDLEVVRYTQFAGQVISIAKEQEILAVLAKEHNYGIVDKKTNELIGSCGLMNLNQLNQTAEIGIIIGNKDYWNDGYGREALALLIDYGFKYLNLENIMLLVYAFNQRGIACYRSLGFKIMGERRNALRQECQQYNIIYMDLIPEDFYAR